MIHFLHVGKECFGFFGFILSLIHSFFFFCVTSGFLLKKKKKKKKISFSSHFQLNAYQMWEQGTWVLEDKKNFVLLQTYALKLAWHRVGFGSIQLNPIPICACVLRRSFFGMTQWMCAFNKMNHKSINTSTTAIKPWSQNFRFGYGSLTTIWDQPYAFFSTFLSYLKSYSLNFLSYISLYFLFSIFTFSFQLNSS